MSYEIHINLESCTKNEKHYCSNVNLFLGGALSFMNTRRYSIWEGEIYRWKIHDNEARTSQNVSMKDIDLKPKIALK